MLSAIGATSAVLMGDSPGSAVQVGFRFPHVSSSTPAVVTGPMATGGCVNSTPASQFFVFGLNVIHPKDANGSHPRLKPA